MSSPVFERASEELEKRTEMGRLEARGTLRIALKEAGLDANHVNRVQMVVVLGRVLPAELHERGVEDVPAVCQALEDAVNTGDSDAAADAASDRIDGLFRRTL